MTSRGGAVELTPLLVHVRRWDGDKTSIDAAIWSDGLAVVGSTPDGGQRVLIDCGPEHALEVIAEAVAGRFAPEPIATAEPDAVRTVTRVFEAGVERRIACDVARLREALVRVARDAPCPLDEPIDALVRHRAEPETYGKRQLEETSSGPAIGGRYSGLRDGAWLFTGMERMPLESGTYRRGVRHGIWRRWGPDGHLWEVRTFRGGRSDGASVDYRTDGRIQSKGSYAAGLRSGEWTTFDERGDVARRTTYVNGIATDR